MAGRLGIHEGGQWACGKKDAGMDFSRVLKHWDKCKLKSALEWVVFSRPVVSASGWMTVRRQYPRRLWWLKRKNPRYEEKARAH